MTEQQERIERRVRHYDPRVSWVAGIAGAVVAGLLITATVELYSVSEHVAVLLDRPIGVSKDEYIRDRQQSEAAQTAIRVQIVTLSEEVQKIREDQKVQAILTSQKAKQ